MKKLKISRIGILSDDGDATAGFYRDYLGYRVEGPRRDKLRKLMRWNLDESRDGFPAIEVTEATGEGIPLGRGIKTIEFETDDVTGVFRQLKDLGAPVTGKGLCSDETGRDFFYLTSPGGGFVRIVEKSKP